jgi:cell division protein FtsB
MTDKEMIASMKDRLALQRDVIGRLHHGREQQVKKNAELVKKNDDLSQEIKWMKGEKT